MRLRFQNQPLNDVSLSLSCTDELPITLDLAFEIGKYVEKDALLTKSDNLFRAPGLSNEAGLISLDPSTLPGFRLILHNGINIYIQSDVIRVVWASSSGSQYPHFEALLEAAEFVQRTFEHITGDRRKHIVTNVSYTNNIVLKDGESIFDFLNHDFFCPQVEGLPLTSQYSWRGENCDLRISLDRMADSNGYVLATAGGIRVEETSEFWDNGSILNKELNVLFNKLITDEAKKQWQLEKN